MSNGGPNPNEPTFPYSGGTDNPGDDTSIPGGPSNVAATETAPLDTVGASLTASIVRYPPLPVGLAQTGTDTQLGEMQAVPPTGDGWDVENPLTAGDPEGGVDDTGRVAGQDETAGETETTGLTSPSAFPEPNP
jgi:hypothetical protein